MACFLAAPTVWGVADSYGIELVHLMREGRSPTSRRGGTSLKELVTLERECCPFLTFALNTMPGEMALTISGPEHALVWGQQHLSP
jgi:hypothetical protein